MAKKSNTAAIAQPDVAGALNAVQEKKSRTDVKSERFAQFLPVIDAGLAKKWSWSAIIKLVREHGGPSLTKQVAEEMYAAHRNKTDTPDKELA